MAVSISLLQFFRTGICGPLYIGMPRTQIEAALGVPDDYAILSRRLARRHRPEEHWKYAKIWRYGGVELFFEEQDSLRGVHIDHLHTVVPSGGEKLHLDPWILRPGLSVAQAQAALQEQQIAYRQRPDPFDETLVHLALETGALLYFQVKEREDTGEPGGLWMLNYPDWLKDVYYDKDGQLLKSGHHKRASGRGA